MSTAHLPEELRVHLPLDLGDNKANFAEFDATISKIKMARAEDRLYGVGLVHATFASIKRLKREGLVPISSLSSTTPNNTFELDQSLGLDRAVFFGWGNFTEKPRGAWVIAKAAELLFDNHTVVTPGDINGIAWSQETAYDELPQEKKQKLQDGYFNKMLSGSDWFELMARRIALQREQKVRMYAEEFGEVKVFRTIRPDELVIVDDVAQKEQIVEQLHNDGFVPPHSK